MKSLCIIIFLHIFMLSCEEPEDRNSWTAPVVDTVPPVIELIGHEHDTAFLHSNYPDPYVSVTDEQAGKIRCIADVHVEVKGEVDTRFPGTYTLAYTAKDDAGNVTSPITRTVIVVENKAAFLNGGYQVAYTATAVIRGTTASTVTADSYSTTVMPFNQQNAFDLNSLKVGDEFVKPSTVLAGNTIEVSFYSPFYSYQSTSTGTLSPAKDSFTIETAAYQWSPPVNYKCRNVYSKMKLEEIKNQPAKDLAQRSIK